MEHQENNVQQNTYIWIESATKASSIKKWSHLGEETGNNQTYLFYFYSSISHPWLYQVLALEGL